MTCLKRTSPILALVGLLFLGALTGCTTPPVSRAALADMHRLCEKEAGITVYMPERWRPDVPAVEAPCPTGKGQCWFNPVGRYYASTKSTTVEKTKETNLSRISIDWRAEEGGLLVANQTWFSVTIPTPVLLSSHPTTNAQCRHGLSTRLLTSISNNKK